MAGGINSAMLSSNIILKPQQQCQIDIFENEKVLSFIV